MLTTAYEDLCDPAHCSYLRGVTSRRAYVPRLTKQLPHHFVLALPSSWNVLLPETRMACSHVGCLLTPTFKSLLKCDFIREVFPYLLYKIGSSQFQTLYIPLSSLIDFHIICHHGPFSVSLPKVECKYQREVILFVLFIGVAPAPRAVPGMKQAPNKYCYLSNE